MPHPPLSQSTVGSSQPVGNIVGDNGAKCLAAVSLHITTQY